MNKHTCENTEMNLERGKLLETLQKIITSKISTVLVHVLGHEDVLLIFEIFSYIELHFYFDICFIFHTHFNVNDDIKTAFPSHFTSICPSGMDRRLKSASF